MKNKQMIVLDIALWLLVIFPVIKLIKICLEAYYVGAKPSFNEGPVYYGMEGVKMMFYMMIFYGFAYVVLWIICLLVAVIFTVYMVRQIKKV